MKKLTVSLVVLVLLVVSSVAAVAAESMAVNCPEIDQIVDVGEPIIIKKWVEDYLVEIEVGKPIPTTVMYDRGGFRGTLYRTGYIRFSDGSANAWYEGWVYSGSVSPFRLATS